ncbi:MAG: DUF4388 domain-containing protein [Candidatus Melainabacteria bacterium]|nr:DUF4388 domain-containing protein [Candidatus Melainabacteria bacterium]
MFKKTTGPEKLQKLASRPTENDLRTFVRDAATNHDTRFNYFWHDQRQNGDFMLSLKTASQADGTYEWRMSRGSGQDARELWFHISRDPAQILALIVDATGENLRDTIDDKKKSSLRPNQTEELITTFDGSEKIPVDELQRLRRPEESALSGELALVHITNILQSIFMAEMSGRLRLESKLKKADVYFENGSPVHATGTMGEGMECMLRVIGLSEGNFQFEPKIKTDEHTITESLESVIMQGILLADNTRAISRLGVTHDSVLQRKNPDLSEKEFETLMEKGEPINMSMLKAFYLLIDGRSSLREILARIGLARSKWVPVVANLIRCGTVIVSDRVISRVTVPAKYIETPVVDSFLASVTKRETGILTYGMLLYMLRHEAARAAPDHPLALVLFQLMPSKPALGSSGGVPPQIVAEVMRRIGEMKRPTDILGHYEHNEFALVLPDMKVVDAVGVAEQIGGSIHQSHAPGQPHKGPDTSNIAVNFGIAGIPEDVGDMFRLLSAAELALKQCRAKGVPILMARNIQ